MCLFCDCMVLSQSHSGQVARVQSRSSLSRYSARSVSDGCHPAVIKSREGGWPVGESLSQRVRLMANFLTWRLDQITARSRKEIRQKR